MIVIIYTDQETFYAGTTNELNKLLSESRSVAGSIDIQTEDHNNDGRAEKLTVNIGLTGVKPADVKSVIVVQSISYAISVSEASDIVTYFVITVQEQLEADMKLPFYSVFQTPNGFAKLDVHGSLELHQKSAFALGAIKREINFDKVHFAENLLEMDMLQMFNYINNQNTTLEYQIDSQYIQNVQQSGSSDEIAQITLHMRVPYSQRFLVKLPFLETIKLAWIQYFSFFILTWYVIYQMTLGYAMKNHIFETTTTSEIHKANKNYLLRNPVKKID